MITTNRGTEKQTISAPVVVLSGPSAVGKSTLVRCLREKIPNLYFSISVTTRSMRPGEVDGVDYSFVSKSKFQKMIDNCELLEWAEIHSGLHRSGTPAQPMKEATEMGRPVLIEVDLSGAIAIKKVVPKAVSVFLAPPSWDELVKRLLDRSTDTPEMMARRLETALSEISATSNFDRVFINRQLNKACARVLSLLLTK